ncbi:MAG TPA: hypothetical protein V6D43_19705 [Candidatus Sericytochromatia bacterium]|jgi:hypothetical protein
MSKNISLFPTYSQKENRTTNYCLLILKMLYEENPKFLSEVLNSLVDESIGGTVGIKFIQQKKEGRGIPDGQINQEAFTVRIETKNHSNFDIEQLKRHLQALRNQSGTKVLLALGNLDLHDEPVFNEMQGLCKEDTQNFVTFAAVSFEDFLQAIQLDYLPKNLADAVTDLGAYFDEENLLPSWKRWLDVVNCAQSFEAISLHHVYICPAESGHYNHKRSQYFGLYRNKCVEQVAFIEAVVDLESDDEFTLKWNNSTKSTADLISQAQDKKKFWQLDNYPMRVFLLADLYSTKFIKDTPGGMFGVKQYFDVSVLGVNSAAELAQKLSGKTWRDYIN